MIYKCTFMYISMYVYYVYIYIVLPVLRIHNVLLAAPEF
jgi:hypothetical protein